VKSVRINDSLYKQAIHFLYGTREEVNRWLCREHGPDEGDLKPGIVGNYRLWKYSSGYGRHYIIILTDATSTLQRELSALAHEVSHHVVYLFGELGIVISKDTDEAFTYYHEWVFDQCVAAILKAEKLRRRRK
jgi:hypothetical protein